MFKSIEEKNVEAEITEKKSKFICNIFYIETVEEAENLIKKLNKKYFDARHNCYAFSVVTENGIVNRFSDDGEPSGTAGGPMLNILNSNHISNVLVVVTRYFGGILLGTGGLVKAYSRALTECLQNIELIQKDLGKEVEIVVSYADLEKLKYYLKQNEIKISQIMYNENVNVKIDITEEKTKQMLEYKENLNFKIVDAKILKTKFITI